MAAYLVTFVANICDCAADLFALFAELLADYRQEYFEPKNVQQIVVTHLVDLQRFPLKSTAIKVEKGAGGAYRNEPSSTAFVLFLLPHWSNALAEDVVVARPLQGGRWTNIVVQSREAKFISNQFLQKKTMLTPRNLRLCRRRKFHSGDFPTICSGRR